MSPNAVGIDFQSAVAVSPADDFHSAQGTALSGGRVAPADALDSRLIQSYLAASPPPDAPLLEVRARLPAGGLPRF